MKKSNAIGIDLGTTNSCVAVGIDNRIQVIPGESGSNTMPSLVSFDDEERLVGDGAKYQMNCNFSNTIYNVKRLMGYKSKRQKSQIDIKSLFYKVIENEEEVMVQVKYKGETKEYTPEEISSMILGKLKARAETYLGVEVNDAVITVPAYFNTAQRQATRNAGMIAGLNVLKVISEPTAAAIGFGCEKNFKEEKHVFVFDFGGGTFDASILSIQAGNFTVLATGGDSTLGGEDIDNLLVEHCCELFKAETEVDVSRDTRALRRLKSACEKAKWALSYASKTKLDIQSLFDDKDLFISLARTTFDEICQGLFKKTIAISQNVLKDAGMKAQDIDEILLVGGSTRIPKVQALIQKLFRKIPNGSVNPDEAVAIGAAKQAASFNDPKNHNQVHLYDVLPLSIGTGIEGGKTFRHIAKNTRIPTKVTTLFTTRTDGQERLCFKVYEGERAFSKDNTLLGSFTIDGLPPAKRGKAGADVTTEIDESGIIKINAVATNGLTGGVTIINNSNFGLSVNEVARMQDEAQKFEEEDRLTKQRVDSMLGLEDYAYELRDLAESGTLSKSSCSILMTLFKSTIDWIKDNQSANEDIYSILKQTLEEKVSRLS